MFKGTIVGRVKNEPVYKNINGNLCCDFTLIAINRYAQKEVTSHVRCTVWNDLARYMQKRFEKGDIIAGCGDASNIPYYGDYTYNLTLTSLEIIKS